MKQTVAITGAAGFIGSHIVEQALHQGFDVIALVRDSEDTSACKHLHQMAERFPQAQLTVTSADLHRAGSFDQPFAHSDMVIHSAGRVSTGKKHDSEEDAQILRANKQGTANVLASIQKSPRVKKLVFTSSIAAVLSNKKGKYTYSEQDFNTDPADKSDSYSYSKTSAEQQIRETISAMKQKGRDIDFVSITPSIVIGPLLSPRHVKTSMGLIADICYGKRSAYPDFYFHFVDVRDVARVHVEALKEGISGRFILPGNPASLLEVAQRIHKLFPALEVPQRKIPTWKLYLTLPFNPNLTLAFLRKYLNLRLTFNDSKTRETFQLGYRDLNHTLSDCVHSFQCLKSLG